MCALDALHDKSMQSSGVAPVKDHPSATRAFAFTAPLGLVHPMACAHVKLLGPCFKTGQRGRRPTRDRDADRGSKATLYKRPLQYPSPPEPGTRGLHDRGHTNFTRALGPTRTVRRVKLQAKCRRQSGRQRSQVFTDPEPPGRQKVTLNRRSRLREPLRLLLHSFTYF